MAGGVYRHPAVLAYSSRAAEGNKTLSCLVSGVSSAHDFFAAAVEQKQTVLVFGGLVAHSWTAREAEILAMVNYRSLWETPKYEPPPFSSQKKGKKVTLTNSGDAKWNSLFRWPEGKIP